jgi:hypothetical protein
MEVINDRVALTVIIHIQEGGVSNKGAKTQ